MKGVQDRNRWIQGVGSNPQARVRLFGFPFAGSGASAFVPWRKYFPETMEFCSIQLPGREERVNDPLTSDVDDIVENIAQRICQCTDLPFAFYGHSMGAGLALRVTRWLEDRNISGPKHLFVAAHRAPCKVYDYPSVKEISQEKLIDVVKYFGGIPQNVLSNQDFIEYYLPIIKNDLMICENNELSSFNPVSCPITLFTGDHDCVIRSEEYAGWACATRADAEHVRIDGDHFFLRTHADLLLTHISRYI